MVLWKYLFGLASKDLETLKKKKQALEDLLSSNKISQQTYEYLNKDVSEALISIEKYLESLISKMKGRIDDLERQIGVLEIFLANSEMMYAAGEIDYEEYEKQSRALITGIESMKREISEIKSILSPPTPESIVMAKSVEVTVVSSESITSTVIEPQIAKEALEHT
ncbi:MAG: CdvA-like protein [Candidatus Bathyarchaeia archaeon]